MSETDFAGIDHLAAATTDMRSTLDFYRGIPELALGGLYWMHGVEGAVHSFLTFSDGRMLSFIQFPEERSRQHGRTHATRAGEAMPAGTATHLALQVPSPEELEDMGRRRADNGIDVSKPIDHRLCTSVYFAGPDVQVGLTSWRRQLDQREIEGCACSHSAISEEHLEQFRSGGVGLSAR